MKNIKVLDCTLRDGGRIIDCRFPDTTIKELIYKLSDVGIDIIEVGFLRDEKKLQYRGNSTFFTDVSQITPFLDKKNENNMYVAFIDYGMFDFESLAPYDGSSIDGIRVGFTRKDYQNSLEDLIHCMYIVKNKGYKLFVQSVNSLSYSEDVLLELVKLVNEIKPYSFGIVDTYGAMYADDIERIYNLIDTNLQEDICIDFHSHNNYQLSFSLAQEIIRLSQKKSGRREIILDATLNGIGKVAGNLNTELLLDFLVRKMNYAYEFDMVLDIIDDYIYPYKEKYNWGYSVPALMAGIYQSHPNNILYLTEKFRLQTKDIKNLISMIHPDLRQRYDYDNIEHLYKDYMDHKVEDRDTIIELRNLIGNKEVLILVPGKSVRTYIDKIIDYVNIYHPCVISVNYDSKLSDYAFFGNSKRYANIKYTKENSKIIITSNIRSENSADYIVNYYGLIDPEIKYCDNSTIMLLTLLKKIGVSKITLAGFDGFNEREENNYMDDSFQNIRHAKEFKELNENIAYMLKKLVCMFESKCEINFLTPSMFEKVLEDRKEAVN